MISLSSLAKTVGNFFVSISVHTTYPGVVAVYSAFLGFFVPSSGSKYLLEAPYLLSAATRLHVDPGWVTVVYGAGEAVSNMIQPFWMLPVLAIMGLKARHIIGFGMTLFLIMMPATIALSVALGLTVS